MLMVIISSMYCQATYRITSEQPFEPAICTTKNLNIVGDTGPAKGSSIDCVTGTDDRRFIKRFTLIALRRDETQQPLTSEALTELVHQLLSNESTCSEVPCSADSDDSEPSSGTIRAWLEMISDAT